MSRINRMDLSMVWLVAKRELKDLFRDWRIITPMVLLTIFFPFLMNYTARQAVTFVGTYGGGTIIPERLVPFLLMVIGFFPITVSLVIALESFVGEKERGTIEPLLSSPFKDWHLFLGKLIAASSIPLITAYLGIAVFMYRLYLDQIHFPSINMLVQTISLTSVQAVLMVSGAMVISTQATSVRAANLLSSFIVIPVAILIQGESILMFWGNNQILWLAVFGVSIIAILLIRVGLAHFQREALLGREIDQLNLKWILRTFWNSFSGGQRNIFSWVRFEIPKVIRKMRITISLILLLGIAGGILAFNLVMQHAQELHIGKNSIPSQISQVLANGFGNFSKFTPSFTFILGNNVRVVGVILLLGLVSFGILGAIAYVINMGLIGAVLAVIKIIGFDPGRIAVAGILPHGVFEIPAIILSTAAVLHIGIMLVTPNSHKTLGEILIESIADWATVSLGLAIPLLILAGIIETWVTPALLIPLLK